ncbi:hypothetical protein ACQPZA_17285 [Pseudonocardia xinjiangensis]|uniref:hypothetical protein n=1 Tax=Pseudonocardia xinjiangensis TaxID=75289 RepID=UPI003D916CE1
MTSHQQPEHEPAEAARPTLDGGDSPDTLDPDALEAGDDDGPEEDPPPSEPEPE